MDLKNLLVFFENLMNGDVHLMIGRTDFSDQFRKKSLYVTSLLATCDATVCMLSY